MGRVLFISVLLCMHPFFALAQCTDWTIGSRLINQSSCASSGSFEIELHGPDAANLSLIQYGIAAPPGGGISVPLNNSPIFTAMPAGTFEVSVVAYCGGTFTGKTAMVTVPGLYEPPEMTVNVNRNTLSCTKSGIITVAPRSGLPPYNIHILQSPPGYTGPVNVTITSGTHVFRELPAGSYRIQVSDACGTGTNPHNVQILSLHPANIDFNYSGVMTASGCNAVAISHPIVQTNGGWSGYPDTFYTISVEIPGLTARSSMRWGSGSFNLPLLPGKTLKDCYGAPVNFTITSNCGPTTIQFSRSFPTPDLSSSITLNCNIDFTSRLSFGGPICYPVSYSYRNRLDGTSYGPFTTNTSGVTTPPIPFGIYDVTYTTADGYTGAGNVQADPLPSSPYQVSVFKGDETPGLHGYIEGFRFTSSHTPNTGRTIELFSGPSGYAYQDNWSASTRSKDVRGARPSSPLTLRFCPGSYVWKITEGCGVYYLPIEVRPEDAPAYTVGIARSRQTCEGRYIWPSGTRSMGGSREQVKFFVYKMNPLRPGLLTYTGETQDSFLLTERGVYYIFPAWAGSSNNTQLYDPSTFFFVSHPNDYTKSVRYDYDHDPLEIDRAQTQAFTCNGTTQGEIHARAKGGAPFSGSISYRYALAREGNGVSGPYLMQNSTGIFTGFNGMAGDKFDVRVEDSCGAFIVQTLEILDLTKTRLISSDRYIVCDSATVRLTTIPLPNATYSWTGPNGFTSAVREPVIPNVISSVHVGMYKVTVRIPQCSEPFTDSTVITSSILPPAPETDLVCTPPIHLVIRNPQPGIQYSWREREYYFNSLVSENTRASNYGAYGYQPVRNGFISAIAIDATTRCISYGPEIGFYSDTRQPFRAGIQTSRTSICPGDTSTLTATGFGNPGSHTGLIASFQWFHDGVPIPGATGRAYAVSLPGNYRVYVRLDTCQADTSGAVEISYIPAPVGNISAPTQDICDGETVRITATTGNDYAYSWYHNGVMIPGINASGYTATDSGSYFAVIANAGCIIITDTLQIRIHQPPDAVIVPGADSFLCAGSEMTISTRQVQGWRYRWLRNDTVIHGADQYRIRTKVPGRYSVIISSDFCSGDTSRTIQIRELPAHVRLMDDTVICGAASFRIPLDAGPGFKSIRWSDGTTARTTVADVPGVWRVQAANECGTFEDSFRIRLESEFFPTLPADTLVCNAEGEALLLVPDILQHIRWSTGATSPAIRVTGPGRIYVQGESPCGTLYDTTEVIFCPPLIHEINFSEEKICSGTCITVGQHTANYPQTYEWSFSGGDPATASGATPGTVCYTTPGTYPITLTASNPGGETRKTRYVEVVRVPEGRFSDTLITVPYKTDLILQPCDVSERVYWYKNDSLICADCPVLSLQPKDWKAVYTCVLYNDPGCTDTCVYYINTTDIPSDIFLPGAFSPNNDGKNDRFGVITDNPNIIVREFRVYNRWGNTVFEGYNTGKSWDGRFRGTPAETGTYFWMLSYRVAGSERIYQMKGDVVLVR